MSFIVSYLTRRRLAHASTLISSSLILAWNSLFQFFPSQSQLIATRAYGLIANSTTHLLKSECGVLQYHPVCNDLFSHRRFNLELFSSLFNLTANFPDGYAIQYNTVETPAGSINSPQFKLKISTYFIEFLYYEILLMVGFFFFTQCLLPSHKITPIELLSGFVASVSLALSFFFTQNKLLDNTATQNGLSTLLACSSTSLSSPSCSSVFKLDSEYSYWHQVSAFTVPAILITASLCLILSIGSQLFSNYRCRDRQPQQALIMPNQPPLPPMNYTHPLFDQVRQTGVFLPVVPEAEAKEVPLSAV